MRMKLLFVSAATLFLVAIAPSTLSESAPERNCLAWEQSMRGSSGQPVISRLDSQAFGQLLKDWVADNCMRLNFVQVLGTHNSYHLEPRPPLLAFLASIDATIAASFEFTHRPLDEQLGQLGIRQVELDVFADPAGGLYATPLGALLFPENPPNPDPVLPELLSPGLKVLHIQDVDFETTCLTFVSCLQAIKEWSAANQGHLPLLILVEAKDDPIPPDLVPPGFPQPVIPVPIGTPELDEIDATIRSVFSPDELITPDDVRGDRTTLEEAVLGDGWPTLNESRGRVMFALDNEGVKRDLYITGHTALEGRVMFTNSPPGSPESAFVEVDEPRGNVAYIQELVSLGYLVRTRADDNTLEARTGDTTRRDAALSSGAHFISTDYPEPDPDFLTGYFVAIPGGEDFRCNPVLSPPGCDSASLEIQAVD